MSGYKRLTPKLRYQIELLVSKQLGVREIARILKVNASTISRELRRCRYQYKAEISQLLAERSQRRRSIQRFKISGSLKTIVDRNLKADLSPEQLSAVLRKEKGIHLSFWSIYRYIERDRLAGGKLKSHLRILRKQRKDRKNPKYRPHYGLVKNRLPMCKRPKVVDKRTRLGDYERDTVHGKVGGLTLLTIVDRKSNYALIEQLKRLNASEAHKATVRALRGRPLKTITNDNGVEFAYHQQTSKKLKTKIYFSRSYASWERGCNENFNGLLRQYFPRKRHIPKLSAKQLRNLELKLNTRPRKRLGFRTPYEIYHGKPYGRVLR